MKIIILITLVVVITSCRNTREKVSDKEPENPLIYREYIEEGGEEYLEEEREKEEGKIYYRDYHTED